MDKKDYWEVRRDGVPLAGGPKSTMPDAKQRKSLREGDFCSNGERRTDEALQQLP